MYQPEGLLELRTETTSLPPDVIEAIEKADEIDKQLQAQVLIEFELITLMYAKRACWKMGIKHPTGEQIEERRSAIALYRARKKVIPFDTKAFKRTHGINARKKLTDAYIRGRIRAEKNYDGHIVTHEEIKARREEILFIRNHPNGIHKAKGEILKKTPEEAIEKKKIKAFKEAERRKTLHDNYIRSKIMATLKVMVRITPKMIEKKKRRLMTFREIQKRGLANRNEAHLLTEEYIIAIIKRTPSYRNQIINNLLIMKVRRKIKQRRAKSKKEVKVYRKQAKRLSN